MSFFHEPPPLDSDIPPPLDDKIRDNDFDLDEEIIDDNLANNCIELELPDLPTDFNVFSSAATDENSSYSHPPPDLTSFVISSSPPPDLENSTTHKEERDVAKEKESLSDVSQVLVDQVLNDDDKVEMKSPVRNEDEIKVENLKVDDEKSDEITKINEETTKISELSEKISEILENPNELINNEEKITSDNLGKITPESEKIDSAEKVEVIQSVLADDDDFDDFVSGVGVVSNPPEDFGNFEEPPVDQNIPALDLKLDDFDDDEFNDFESAKVESKTIIQETAPEPAPQVVQFEADFSSFNAFPATDEDEPAFSNFQDSKPAVTSFDSQLKPVEDDDDDFGDFSDFTQAPAAPVPASTSAQPLSLPQTSLEKPADVNGILDMMFPALSPCPETTESTSSFKVDDQVIKSDSFVNKFNDFDSTLALGYLYNSSKASQTLVKALGIDTRNILLGPQWASASSNMPRFAANMSFNPIEPLKPLHSSSEIGKPAVLQPVKPKTDAVPEVEFDWNSAGLINPLDAHKSNYLLDLEHLRVAMANSDKINSSSSLNHATLSTNQMTTDIDDVLRQFDSLNSSASFVGTNKRNSPQPKPQQPLEPLQQLPESKPSFSVVDQEVSQVFEAEAKTNSGYKPDLGDVPPAYQWSNESQQHHLATSNIIVRERTIKLPETHIFTPVKGTSPIAREVVSRDVSPGPDDPYYPSKGSIVVKEYHDVEYSLEPKKKSDPDAEFDDFQSAQPAVIPQPVLLPFNLLEPQKVEAPSTEIKWPEPGVDVQFSSDLDFLEAEQIAPPPQVAAPAPIIAPPVVPPPLMPPAPSIESAKPVVGISPTQNNSNDDDFDDFQAAPVVKPAPKAAVALNDPITLSPARLAAQQANQKPTWINAMDDEEVSRIEAAFPKCKVEKKLAQNDDDDWTDFVAVTPASTIFNNPQPSVISSAKLSNGDGDDWSDFVSVPPPIARIPSAKSSGAISSQLQSKPNFSSWNQPIGKHQYVNHSTSFLTNEPRNQNQQFTSSNYPYVTDKFARDSITITDNFNYKFNHQEIAMSSIGGFNSHQPQPRKPNGISTVLPELDFAMPKNMGLSRGGHMDPGKK